MYRTFESCRPSLKAPSPSEGGGFVYNMVKLTHALNPEDVERYIARALGDGEPPLGHYQEAWHIIRADDDLPALILFKHVVVSLDDLYRLCNLMFTARIYCGYLVYIEGDMPVDIIDAARKIGWIEVMDHFMAEKLLEQELNKRVSNT